MKRHTYIATIVLTLITLNIFGQDGEIKTDSTSTKLFGTWYLTGQSNSDGTLTFHRTTTAPLGWGSRIEIHSNGDFVDAYSAKCGNDEKLHNDKGLWILDQRTMTFKTTIPIDYKGTDYKIQKLDTTELILSEIKKMKKSSR